jgi:hypothetical protein
VSCNTTAPPTKSSPNDSASVHDPFPLPALRSSPTHGISEYLYCEHRLVAAFGVPPLKVGLASDNWDSFDLLTWHALCFYCLGNSASATNTFFFCDQVIRYCLLHLTVVLRETRSHLSGPVDRLGRYRRGPVDRCHLNQANDEIRCQRKPSITGLENRYHERPESAAQET